MQVKSALAVSERPAKKKRWKGCCSGEIAHLFVEGQGTVHAPGERKKRDVEDVVVAGKARGGAGAAGRGRFAGDVLLRSRRSGQEALYWRVEGGPSGVLCKRVVGCGRGGWVGLGVCRRVMVT